MSHFLWLINAHSATLIASESEVQVSSHDSQYFIGPKMMTLKVLVVANHNLSFIRSDYFMSNEYYQKVRFKYCFFIIDFEAFLKPVKCSSKFEIGKKAPLPVRGPNRKSKITLYFGMQWSSLHTESHSYNYNLQDFYQVSQKYLVFHIFTSLHTVCYVNYTVYFIRSEKTIWLWVSVHCLKSLTVYLW